VHHFQLVSSILTSLVDIQDISHAWHVPLGVSRRLALRYKSEQRRREAASIRKRWKLMSPGLGLLGVGFLKRGLSLSFSRFAHLDPKLLLTVVIVGPARTGGESPFPICF